MAFASNVLVIGAGELGNSILTSLAQLVPTTTKITVLLRPSTLTAFNTSPSSSPTLSHLQSLKVSFLPGDISTLSLSSLTALLKPFDLVISALGYASGPGSQMKITKAVLAAGVRRYVPWQFGVDYEVVGRGSAQPVWDEQLDIRELLRSHTQTSQKLGEGGEKGKTEWVIISTGMFMSFLFEPFFGVVTTSSTPSEEITVRALGYWSNSVTLTTPADIGHLTSLILLSTPKITNEIIQIAGSTISYSELADTISEVSGKEVKRELWDSELLKGELEKDPENHVKRYRVAFAEGRGVSWDLKETWNFKKRIEMTDVRSFAREKFGKKTEGDS